MNAASITVFYLFEKKKGLVVYKQNSISANNAECHDTV